jgi:hypothetical protein
MAIPGEMSRRFDEWVGTVPSPWYIYLRLRWRGCLSPGATGAAVRRVIREAIDEWDQPRREQLVLLRARGLATRHAAQVPLFGASWNLRVTDDAGGGEPAQLEG